MSASLSRISPPGPATTAEGFVESIGLWDEAGRGTRPRVVAAMIGAADGRATVGGSASPLGIPADRDMLRELRTASDALLVGPGTLIAERYATVLDPPQRARRLARDLPAEPLVATISRRGDGALAQVPLFAEAGLRVQVYTEADPPPKLARGADVDVHAVARGTLTTAGCLEHLYAERGVRSVVCEGGPTLLRELVAHGLVDDLVLTLAPVLVAGEGRSVLHGPVLDPPARFKLANVLRAEDHLFLHYVPGP